MSPTSPAAPQTDLDRVVLYHDATKHHPRRYARSLGYLDWATQPDPFRRFRGTQKVHLSFAAEADEPAYDALYSPGAIKPRPVDRAMISEIFECALAITAWKSYRGSTWALRANPSSGNLHPTEGYLVSGPAPGIGDAPAVYHYAPREHVLERRHAFDPDLWRRLASPFGGRVLLFGLSSILWREAWKYGERAFRYCQHDVGHALACLRLACDRVGWRLTLLQHLGDADVAHVLGLDRDADFADAEHEEPELLAAAFPGDFPGVGGPADLARRGLDGDQLRAIADGPWSGRANRLSDDHVEWDIIDMAADITRKPRTEPAAASRSADGDSSPIDPLRPMPAGTMQTTAREVILRRRSATDFDGRTTLAADDFHAMLRRLMPDRDGGGAPPWDVLDGPPRIDLLMFVHLVDSLPPGLYALVRDPSRVDRLRASMKREFLWSPASNEGRGLPLFLLTTADCRRAAAQLSLGQSIAGTSAFSLGMIADFERSLNEFGPWFYRRLFWEAGMIGQVLYLEAEAAALRRKNTLRATGIGAYFDDLVHEVFGLAGHAFQSMYHFTVGGAVEDERLTSRPPYDVETIRRRAAPTTEAR